MGTERQCFLMPLCELIHFEQLRISPNILVKYYRKTYFTLHFYPEDTKMNIGQYDNQYESKYGHLLLNEL